MDLREGEGRGTSDGYNPLALKYATYDILHSKHTCSHPGAHISEQISKHIIRWNLHRFTMYIHSCMHVYIHMCMHTCTSGGSG